MQVPWPRGTRRDPAAPATPARSFCGSFGGLLVGNPSRHGTGRRGEGVTDSHATPLPSGLPPPPRGRELHLPALPPEGSGSPPLCPAPRAPAARPEPRTGSRGAAPPCPHCPDGAPGTLPPPPPLPASPAAAAQGPREQKRGRMPSPAWGRREC